MCALAALIARYLFQDDLFRSFDRVLDAYKRGGKSILAPPQASLPATTAKLAKVAGAYIHAALEGSADAVPAAKAQALWKSAKEKQHFETALSHAIELTQHTSAGGSSQDSESVKILEQKRSQIKLQVQNELSLRDRALQSHASLMQALYDEARQRLQHVPADLLLQLPAIFISDSFEQDTKAIFKASEQLDLVKQNPVAMFGQVARLAPSFAVQDAVFVACFHAVMMLASETAKLPHLLTHFNKLRWVFEQFSDSVGSGLPSIMSKSKFIECAQRVCCSLAHETKLLQLYDALSDAGEMSFHNFCCAFLHSEPQEPVNEVRSVPFFDCGDNIFDLGGRMEIGADKEPLTTSGSQVCPALTCVSNRSLSSSGEHTVSVRGARTSRYIVKPQPPPSQD